MKKYFMYLLPLYLEVLFHIAVFKSFSGIILPALVGLLAGIIVGNLTEIIKEKFRGIIRVLIAFLQCFYFCAQFIYYKVFGIFLSLVSTKGAGDAMNFKAFLMGIIGENAGYVIFFFIPAVLFLSFIFIPDIKLEGDSNNKKTGVIYNPLLHTLVIFVVIVTYIAACHNERTGPYKLLTGRFNLELSMEKLGMHITTVQDGSKIFNRKKEEKKKESHNTPVKTTGVKQSVSKNTVKTDTKTDVKNETYESVDFDHVLAETEDEKIKALTEYLKAKKTNSKNEYTGMFKDYNIVFLTCESLSIHGIKKECTPTLYKIFNEGFVFENFYDPIWYHSTIDGEFAALLSQYPSQNSWSFNDSISTYQPYALGNLLNKKGYKSFAYHDFNANYYDRTKSHPNLGYDFKAIDYGLELPDYNHSYSDEDMIDATVTEYKDLDKFNVYYMTFSGHLGYNYRQNPICVKNKEAAKEVTKGMNLSEEAECYIATHLELERAMNKLLEALDKAGKLEKTLIIMIPDHYPYGLSDKAYNELAGEDVCSDKFLKQKNGLAIWSASMKKPVKVEKLCASVDLLPTVLNLIGADYDSRLLSGNDIFSEAEPLVVLSDLSFMTDKMKYDKKTDKAESLVEGYELSDEEVDAKIEEVEDRVYYSGEIIAEDYFDVIQ